MANIVEALRKRLKEEQVSLDVPMRTRTTFKVGGKADIYVRPLDTEETAFVVKTCRSLGAPFIVLGNGSNILVRDGGIREVVISTELMNKARVVDGDIIVAGAGAQLCDTSGLAMRHSLTGLEFACGIPGSVGGAVFMNAGAYDGEIRNVFQSAAVVTAEGEVQTINAEDMNFGYRKSAAQLQGLIITEVRFKLEKGDPNAIAARVDDLTHQREEKQPLESPSAGSTFKRPPGRFAGKLIADSGLRGHIIGGAQVSEKHCGFIINRGGAKAKDILDLIAYVQEVVYAKYGVMLEPEVRILGED